jgi:hypothetical protein
MKRIGLMLFMSLAAASSIQGKGLIYSLVSQAPWWVRSRTVQDAQQACLRDATENLDSKETKKWLDKRVLFPADISYENLAFNALSDAQKAANLLNTLSLHGDMNNINVALAGLTLIPIAMTNLAALAEKCGILTEPSAFPEPSEHEVRISHR